MYRCNACGEIFDELGCKAVEESRGEYWGIPCSETVYYECCPHCGEEDDFEEGNLYEITGKWGIDDPHEKIYHSEEFDEEVFGTDEEDAEEELCRMLEDMAYNKYHSVEDFFYTIDWIEEV